MTINHQIPEDTERSPAWSTAGYDTAHVNVGRSERCLSMLLGSALLLSAMRPRTRLLWLLAGGALILRGATGRCPIFSSLGIDTTTARLHPATSVPHQRGIRVEDSILIHKPAEQLYRFWRSLENLPRFMSQHVAVDTRSHWTVQSLSGATFEWDAEIINDIPNELIAWRSLAGADLDHAGSVHFERVPDGSDATKVKVVLEYRPPAGKLGFGIAKLFGQEPGQVITKDLRRLKQLMEPGEIDTVEGQPHGST
jgi:uncharacterized membrane protein